MLSEILKKSLPVYEVKFPSSNKTHRFRPMTVKEEKTLLLAQNEGKPNGMAYAIKNIIESCFEGIKNAGDLDLIDSQVAFLHLRSKSIGEVFSFQIKCPETGQDLTLSCQLSDFKQKIEKDKLNKIKLKDDIILILKSPTLRYFIEKEGESNDPVKDLFVNCFSEVHTTDSVISKSEISKEEIQEFFDTFTIEQYSNIMKFFENIPKMELEINYTTKDEVQRKVRFDGLESFFELASVI
jgi:hypothetical protein